MATNNASSEPTSTKHDRKPADAIAASPTLRAAAAAPVVLVLHDAADEAGTAATVAERIQSEAKTHKIHTKVARLNDFEDLGLQLGETAPELCAIVVASGDSSASGSKSDKFMDFLKRSAGKPGALGVITSYSVLALSDASANDLGQKIDSGLAELGAKRNETLTRIEHDAAFDSKFVPWLGRICEHLARRQSRLVDSPRAYPKSPGEGAEDAQSKLVQSVTMRARAKSSSTVLIMYGSEMGNARSIAEKIHDEAGPRKISSKLATLDEFDKLGLTAGESGPPLCVVIVVSTTGNGDAPKGAEKFFRFVNKRNHASSAVFSAVKSYIVLGLGDTNYDKFAYVGKQIDKRLADLGAQRMAPVTSVDEVEGIESIVEPWLTRLWDLLSHRHASLQDAYFSPKLSPFKSGQTPEKAKASAVVPDLSLESLSGADAAKSVAIEEPRQGWLPSPSPLERFDSLGLKSEGLAAATQYPAVKRAEHFNIVVVRGGSQNLPPDTVADTSAFGLPVFVRSNKKVANAADRVVLELKLEINPSLEYKPGDSLSIECPNPAHVVQGVAKLLNIAVSDAAGAEDWILNTATGKATKACDFLSTRLDLVSPPGKATLRTLAEACTSEEEKNQMIYLSSATGRDAFAKLIEAQRPTILELLEMFPSCKPTLGCLSAAILSPPAPRSYSIASSPAVTPDEVTLALSVVQTKTASGRVVYGVCSNQLQLATEGSMLHAAVKSAADFKLPDDVSKPLIMIGPGTGVTPFLGFLRHRPALRQMEQNRIKSAAQNVGMWRNTILKSHSDAEESAVQMGSATLYFGCRAPDVDYLFRKELEKCLEDKSLTSLRVAFSRLDPANKVYVQKLLQEDGEALARQIVEESAYVFVCGDGAKMAKEVRSVLSEALQKWKAPEGEATWGADYVRKMQVGGRFVQDIWAAQEIWS